MEKIKEILNKAKLILKISPEEGFDKFLKWLDVNKRICFFTALFFGLLTHFHLLANMIFTQDGLMNSIHYSVGPWEYTLGRWGADFVDNIRGNLALPFVTTTFSIIILSISSVLVCDLFELKNKIFVILTSAILVTFPCITAMLLCVFLADVFCYAFCLSILAVYLIRKLKYKKTAVILSSLCIMVQLSLYQSYIGVTVGLYIMLAVLDLLKNNKTMKEILVIILKGIVTVVAGGILYLLATKIILHIKSLILSNYGGADSVGLENLKLIFTSIKQACFDFTGFFFTNNIIRNSQWKRDKLYFILFFIVTLSTLIYIIKNKIYKDWKKTILIIIGCILIPIGLNFIILLAPGNNIYIMNGLQMFLVFPMGFAILELFKKEEINILKWIAMIVTVVIILTFFIANIASYTILQVRYNQAYSVTTRMLDRIEKTEGYYPAMQMMIAGLIDDSNYLVTLDLYKYTHEHIVNNAVFHGTYYGAMGTWQKYLDIFHGFRYVPCKEGDFILITESEEFKQMGIFPEENSIRIINGIMVVKFKENPERPF